MVPRTVLCQLWTDVRIPAIAGYSLHDHPDSARRPDAQSLRDDAHGLPPEYVPACDPYLVELTSARTGWFRPGLPSNTVVNPSGVLSLLSHLDWPGICGAADGTWHERAGRGIVEIHGERRFVSSYWDLARLLRQALGTYVVRVDNNSSEQFALFVRRTPEDLLRDLEVACVMES